LDNLPAREAGTNFPPGDLKGRAPSGPPSGAGNIAADYRHPISHDPEIDVTGNMRFFARRTRCQHATRPSQSADTGLTAPTS